MISLIYAELIQDSSIWRFLLKSFLKFTHRGLIPGGGSNGGVAGLVLTVRGDLTGAPAGGGGPSLAVINPFGGV